MAAKKGTASARAAGPQRRRKAANKGRRARERKQAEIQARDDLARLLYLSGTSPDRIRHAITLKFKVSASTAKSDLRRMFDVISRDAAAIPASERGAAKVRGEGLLLQAFEVAKTRGDAKGMVLAAERATQLAIGSAPFGPTRHEVSGPDGGPMQTQACPVAVLPAMELHVRLPDRPAHADATPTGPAGP